MLLRVVAEMAWQRPSVRCRSWRFPGTSWVPNSLCTTARKMLADGCRRVCVNPVTVYRPTVTAITRVQLPSGTPYRIPYLAKIPTFFRGAFRGAFKPRFCTPFGAFPAGSSPPPYAEPHAWRAFAPARKCPSNGSKWEGETSESMAINHLKTDEDGTRHRENTG